MKNLIAMKEAELQKYPSSFWAKKFDETAHMSGENYTVLCGKYGAMLGNNYADGLKHVCPDCLKRYFMQSGDYVEVIDRPGTKGFVRGWLPDSDDIAVKIEGVNYPFKADQLKHVPTEKEYDILQSFHLRGVGGNRFTVMPEDERKKMLDGLIRKGWLKYNSPCDLTSEGIEVSKPNFQNN